MKEFLSTPFTEPYYFITFTSIVFTVVFLRYIIFSGLYHHIFFTWLKPQVGHRIINTNTQKKEQAKTEIIRSAITSLIFALSGTIFIILWQKGYTQIYIEWNSFPIWYFPISIFIVLFFHETYYYWIHRWMHLPKIYRIVHKWHHDSIETTSLTSFSFHPIESFFQAIFIPIIVLFIPLHLWALFVILFIMTLSGTINHAGVEIFPKKFNQHWLGKWLIGATHHDLHHKQFRYNYGLYFTFWDKWMNTESPKYDKLFEEKTEA